jgi:hypothetical protein
MHRRRLISPGDKFSSRQRVTSTAEHGAQHRAVPEHRLHAGEGTAGTFVGIA